MSTPMLIFALCFILFTLSNLNNKTWDSFNILLVLIFIFFGLFFRETDDVSSTMSQQKHAFIASVFAPTDDAYVNLKITDAQKYASHQCFDFSSYELQKGDDTYHTPPIIQLQSPAPPTGDSCSERSTTFHHGLSSQSSCGTRADRYKFRCSDTPVNHRTRRRGDEKEDNVKEIPVEIFETRSSTPPRKSPTPPIPPTRVTSPTIFRRLFKKGLCKGNKVHSVLEPMPLRLMPATKPAEQIRQSSVPKPFKSPEMEFPETEDADVDSKATTFIAKLKNEWKLEKLNSMKERLETKYQAQAQAQAH